MKPATTLACLLLTAMSPACAVSHEPRLVSLPQQGLRPATHIDAISDYRTAVASIVSTLERDLGLAPFPVTFRFYPSRTAFEAALIGVGHDPAFARATARTMIAVGGHRGVLLNEAAMAPMSWADRTLLLAHELGHSLQYELGGGRRGTSDQWLREGFAEWLSLQVLERLDAISLSGFRRQRQLDLRTAGRANIPRLEEMVTFREWVAIGRQRGTAAYAVSFFAVELLVERHGVATVLDYFARFASSADRAGNFEAAFGQHLDAFEADLTARLWSR